MEKNHISGFLAILLSDKKLFLSKDINEVNKLTAELNEYNRIRQETEKSIYEVALNLIQKEHI